MKQPKLLLEDFGGDQAKFDRASRLYDAAWDKANPAGTPEGALVMPKISAQDAGSMADWAEFSRAYDRAYDRANQKGINEQTAEAIASGELTGKDAMGAYGAMAAKKMDELQAMAPFNYDFNKDALFKTLSDSYMRQAKKAAANTAAAAAARTGGYGNSYGAAAAGQQYNDALGNLYSQVPALQEAAYERYLNDKNDLYKQAGYYSDLENQLYGRTQDELAQENWQKTFDYSAGQDKQAHEDYLDERDYQRKQDEEARKLDMVRLYASLGQYDAVEDLLGVKLDAARTADDINMLLQLAPTLGLDMAMMVMAQMKRGGNGTDNAQGGQNGQADASFAPTGSSFIDALLGTRNGSALAIALAQANGLTGDDLAQYRQYSSYLNYLGDNYFDYQSGTEGSGGSGSGGGSGKSSGGSGSGGSGYSGGETPKETKNPTTPRQSVAGDTTNYNIQDLSKEEWRKIFG